MTYQYNTPFFNLNPFTLINILSIKYIIISLIQCHLIDHYNKATPSSSFFLRYLVLAWSGGLDVFALTLSTYTIQPVVVGLC
jgi:hypothetical protein